MNETKTISALEHELRDRYGRAAWTHKTHEKDADRYHGYHVFLTWTKIVLSGLAAICCGSSPLLEKNASAWAAVIGGALFLVNLIFENRNYESLSNAHRNTATNLLQLREELLSLISDLHMENCNIDEISNRRKRLLQTWCNALKTAPRTSDKAYRQATKALHDEELTFSDKEIDHILPPAFRIVEETP